MPLEVDEDAGEEGEDIETETPHITHKRTASKNKRRESRVQFVTLFNECKRGNYISVQSILDSGREMDTCMKDGSTPISIAAECGHVQVLKVLVCHPCFMKEGVSILNVPRNDGSTPLIIASEGGRLAAVQYLIEAGADLEMARITDTTALFIAARCGHFEIVCALIQAGADVNRCKSSGSTPLFIAAQEGHLRIVEALVNAGASVHVRCPQLLLSVLPCISINFCDSPSTAGCIHQRGHVPLYCCAKWTRRNC
jgi:ankyrin repeat protein